MSTATIGRSRFIRESWDDKVFRVWRGAYRDPEVFALERERLWGRGWLYLGHASELAEPGDYRVRTIGGRPLIFLRDVNGVIRAFLNACPHRGTALCRDEEGNAKRLRCFYHAWTFDTEGRLISLPDAEAYPEDSEFRDRLGLRAVAHLDQIRDFVFISYDPGAPPLKEYLGDAADYFELVADHSATGMRMVAGTQRYLARANWKLLVENAMDGYHFAPSHATFIEYLNRTGYVTSDGDGTVEPMPGGHQVSALSGHGGRIGLNWEPRFGEDEKPRTERKRAEIMGRLGEERGRMITDYFRTLHMFPNLLVFDIESLSIRMLEPVAPDLTEVRAWALAPSDEAEETTALRLRTLVSFIGPGGLATPDDTEAQESIQRSIDATAGDGREHFDWNDVSRGMSTPQDELAVSRSIDEAGIRNFWRSWYERLSEPAGP